MAAIRANQETLIEALTPGTLTGYKYKAEHTHVDFREWAEKNPTASFRRFTIRDISSYGLPDTSNEAVENVPGGMLEVLVSYPKTWNQYGRADERKAWDVIEEDAHLIDGAIGIRGYGSYVAGQNASRAMSKDIDEGQAVWFLRCLFEIDYYRAV